MKMDAKSRVSAETKARDAAARREFADRPGPGDRRLKMEGKAGDYFALARLAKELKARREGAGLSLGEAAMAAEMEETALCRLEKAQGNPTLRTLCRWARGLGCELVLMPEVKQPRKARVKE